jgi:phosphotransferase system enzyme I (PtsI)
MKRLEGIPISPGYASGIAVVYDFDVGRRIEVPASDATSFEVESEWKRLDEALERSHQDLQLLEETACDKPGLSKSLAVLSAHAAMTHEIAALVKQYVGRELVNVEEALDAVVRDWVDRLQRLDSAYLRQREQDVRDVGRRVTRYLAGSLPWNKGPLPRGSIVVAHELLPSEAIELVNCGVVAIVSEHGGKYSHTAIVARSLGIPAITGVSRVSSQIHPGTRLLVDGQTGNIVVAPTVSAEQAFTKLQQEYADRKLSVKACGNLPCATEDGVTVSLLANIGLPEETDAVGEFNLAGVGLFRTEFLFLESHERPSVQKQVEIYDKIARDLEGQPLVIRTFDLGGDKLPPFLLAEQSDAQDSLHLRGLRFSLAERNLLDEQLQAILRVAQTADIRILFPMVIGSDDLAQAMAAIDRILEKCGYLRTPPIGAMIETPAALYSLAEILDLADFLALGTNDLTQYMLATDRDLAERQDDCTALHPAVLRAIKQVVEAAEKHQCPVCVCGEEAGDADFACLLIGLGIRELSLSPVRVGAVRQALRGIKERDAVETANRALACQNPQEVRALLTQLRSRVAEVVP